MFQFLQQSRIFPYNPNGLLFAFLLCTKNVRVLRFFFVRLFISHWKKAIFICTLTYHKRRGFIQQSRKPKYVCMWVGGSVWKKDNLKSFLYVSYGKSLLFLAFLITMFRHRTHAYSAPTSTVCFILNIEHKICFGLQIKKVLLFLAFSFLFFFAIE